MALRPVSASFQVRTAVRSKSSFNSCTRWTKLESSGFTLSPPTGASAAAASQERPVLRVQTSARLCWWNSSWFTCARSLRRPGGNLFNQFIAPRHAFRQTPAQQDEIPRPLLLAPVVEGTETGAGLRHHVERQPGTIGFAVAVPVFQLVFAEALYGLGEAVGHGVQQVGGQRIYGLIEKGQVYGTLGE